MKYLVFVTLFVFWLNSAFATDDICSNPDAGHQWTISDVQGCFDSWCKLNDISHISNKTIAGFVNTIFAVKSFLSDTRTGEFDCHTLEINKNSLVALDLSYSNLKKLNNYYSGKMKGPIVRLEPLMYFPNVYRYQLIGNKITDISPLWETWNPHTGEINKDSTDISNNFYHKSLKAHLSTDLNAADSLIVKPNGVLNSYLGYLDVSLNQLDLTQQKNLNAIKNLRMILDLYDGLSYVHTFYDGNWCITASTGDTCGDPQ